MSVHTKPDSNTLLLIQSNHADESTSIVDSSPANNAITLSGDTAHSTNQYKFGASSIEMSGGTNSSGDYMKPVIAGTAGTDSFTIDCWIRFEQARANWTNYAQLFVNGSGTNQFEIIFVESTGKVGTWGTGLSGHGGNTGNQGTFTDWDDQNWHHFAWVRHNGYVKIYHNGNLDSSNAMTATSIDFSAASYHTIGSNPGEWTRALNAHIDEFRISLGARWVDSFVPPNKPYSVLDDDFVTDVAGIEDDGAGNTTFGRDIVVKSDPDEASIDSVFSVSAKDGTVLMNMSANGVLESGLLKVDAEGAVHVYNPHAGIYMTSFSDEFDADEVKNIQMKTNVNVFGSMFINVTGNYGNANAIGAYEVCFSVGVNSVNTGIFSPGSDTIVNIGGTSAHLSFGTPVKPDAVTYNIPVTNLHGTYAIDFYFNVVFKGYTSGIISIKLV